MLQRSTATGIHAASSFLLAFRALTLSSSRRGQCLSCQQHQRLQYQQQYQQRRAVHAPTRDDDYTPHVLGRPIGFRLPPLAGENTGEDLRTAEEKKADMLDKGKRIQKRKELLSEKPYFQDFKTVRYHNGKSFLANPRIYNASSSLFFPNFHGRTLANPDSGNDTTPVLEGKLSVVSVYSSVWGENQVKAWLSPEANPQLHDILTAHPRLTQRVDIALEDNWLKAMLTRTFMYRLRAERAESEHDKFFFVTKGASNDMREAIGMFNAKVAHVYLLDKACRIRWAGSASPEGDELEYLNKGLTKMISEVTSGLKKSGGGTSDIPQQ